MILFSRILSSVLIALRMVVRNKLRAALTVIGITIGIAAVVTMIALGKGARASVSSTVQSLGSNALMVFPNSSRTSGAKNNLVGIRLSELDCEALSRGGSSIRLAAPFMRASAQAIYEGQNTKTSVIGSRLSYFDVRNLKVTKGEAWTPSSESTNEKVVLIGQTTRKDLFGTLDPIGRSIRIGRYPYRVIGMLEEKGNSPFGEDQDQIVLMPITTLRTHVVSGRPNEVQAIMISATSAETTERAKKQATEILRQRHRLTEGEENDFDIRSQAELQSFQESIFGALSGLLVAIAAVSLVVGGIGVMNIMLVSVTERTREIGIRMAIGAREADILIQFLMEAVVLALLGGLVGTALGYALIFGLAHALDWSMSVDPASLMLALGVSSAIGIVFGFFPARRAARLDPVQALGRE
jgi:putative ABC transport system permease protein